MRALEEEMTESQGPCSDFTECAAGLPGRPSERGIPADASTGASDAPAGAGIPSAGTAARLVPVWKEAAEIHLEAEYSHTAAQEAVEEEQDLLPDAGPAPEAPDPAGFAAPATRVALAACDEEREQIESKVRELCGMAEREAGRNSDYGRARARYGKALDEWYAASRRENAKARLIAGRHGLDDAGRAFQDARRRLEEAGRQLLNASIHSQADVLAVLCVLLHMADLNYGIFEDEEKCLGVDPAGLLRRLAPFLPFSPAAPPL